VIVVAGLLWLTFRDDPGKPLIQRVRDVCEQYPELADGEYHELVDEARRSKLTREGLIAFWREQYPPGPRVGAECLNAMVDAGFYISDRWDGKPKR
jgi:hypothetical protein